MKIFQENSTLAMWFANMNWLGVLGKKLVGFKDRVSVKKSVLEGATHGEGEVGRFCKIFLRELNPGYVVANMNWLGVFGKKLAGVKD